MNSAEQFNIGEAASRSGVSAKMVRRLVDCCQRDHRPVCPILEELSGHEAFVSWSTLSWP